jgi:hypothetical protein
VDKACSTHGGIVSRKHEEEDSITINLRVRDRMGFKSGLKKRCVELWDGFICRSRDQWWAAVWTAMNIRDPLFS